MSFPSEWECDYPHWQELYGAVASGLTLPLVDQSAEEILFALARDNEDEVILNMLVEAPGIALSLAERALEYEDMNARWQMAVVLGRIGGEAAHELRQRFTSDESEYVRRRALSAEA